jgi:hypothetical protein
MLLLSVWLRHRCRHGLACHRCHRAAIAALLARPRSDRAAIPDLVVLALGHDYDEEVPD